MFKTKIKIEKLEKDIENIKDFILKQTKFNEQTIKTLEAYDKDIKKLETHKGLSTIEKTLYEYITTPKTKNKKGK